MPYKVGDTVLITSDTSFFVSERKKEHCGTIMTIDYADKEMYYDGEIYFEYAMVEDGNTWLWYDRDILHKVIAQPKEPIKNTNLPSI